MDAPTLLIIGMLSFSAIVFILFGRFTLKLIRQHKDLYRLLHALEEEEKKKST